MRRVFVFFFVLFVFFVVAKSACLCAASVVDMNVYSREWWLTAAGRIELERLVRECAERVWWRRFRDGFFRAMLFIIPATWTVVAVLIDLFRERILAWLDGLFG